MSIVYLVGPSGAGKSALCRALAESDAQYQHVDLDEEVKKIAPSLQINRQEDWDVRWEYCLVILNSLDRLDDHDHVYVVDSGAGALMAAEGRKYFIACAVRTICLNGDPKLIYQRNSAKFRKRGAQPRVYQEFYADEYSEARIRVYSAARYGIDTVQQSESDALQSLRDKIDLLTGRIDQLTDSREEGE